MYDRLEDGTFRGKYTVSVGAEWVDLTSASFTSIDGSTIPADATFVALETINTHATQRLGVLHRASAAEALTAGFIVEAGAADNEVLTGADGVITISIIGSGAATTGELRARFVA